jgi:SAM-dependent methyltransferase
VKEFTVPELHALLLPHFRPEEERYLDAPLPSSQALVKRFYVFYGRRRDRRPWWRRVWRRPPAGEPPARGGGEVRYCRPESYRSRVAQEEVSCVGKYAGSQASLAHHERHWLAPGYLEDLRLTFRELLGPSYGGTVLDVGCGMGHLHRRLGIASERYTGVDINRLFLDAGRRSFPGLRLVQGEAACLPFADNRFDCVLCSDVLIHLEDMRPALRELIRVSRGKVLLRLRSGNGGFQGPKVVHDPRRDRLFLKLTLGAERRYFYYNVLAPEDLLALLLREGIEKYHALDLLPADAGAMGLTKVLFDVGQAKGAQGKSSG